VSNYHAVARAAYALDRDEETWVHELARCAHELFGSDTMAYVIRPHAAPGMRVGASTTIGTAFATQSASCRASHALLTPEMMTAMYGGGPYASLWSERADALQAEARDGEVEMLEQADSAQRRGGTADTIGVFGGSIGGGCLICVTSHRSTVAPRTRWALQRVAAHVDAAFRLREALDTEPDALLDERGTIVERRVSLDSATDEITRGFCDIRESATLAENDPESAVAVWRGLIAGRWSLIETREGLGRRTLLLRRNEVLDTHGDDEIARRTFSVVTLVCRGHSNKFIAYELGLPISTVASDIRRVLLRLGLSRRGDLIRLGPGAAVTSSSMLAVSGA
jgi:DNA-binding CsgD family transcriptional regulator